MPKKDVATEAEWREMATEAREMRDRIGSLIIKSQHFVPVTVTKYLHRSQDALDEWRNLAEEEMFKRGGPKEINIFYGPRGKT